MLKKYAKEADREKTQQNKGFHLKAFLGIAVFLLLAPGAISLACSLSKKVFPKRNWQKAWVDLMGWERDMCGA